MKKYFFMIKYHTDNELTAFLQKKAQLGLALDHVKGNYFFFKEKNYDGKRVCALTLYRNGNEFSTEMQVREKLTLIRKEGWDCICIGKQETLKDVKRHVYLIEEIPGSELPSFDDRSEKRAEIRGKFKSLSNLLLCLIYASVLGVLLTGSLIKVVSSNTYIILTLIFGLLLVFMTVMCIWSALNAFFIRKHNLVIDFSTRLVSICLIAFALFLVFDSFVQDRGKTENVKIGATVYKLYKDEVPVKLEDLGLATTGPYRSTRHIEQKSWLSSYSYSFDENFGVKAGETVYDNSSRNEVCYVSYTSFKSESAFLRDMVVSQVVPSSAVRNTELEKALGTEQSFVAKSGEIILIKNNCVIIVKSGLKLSVTALKTLASEVFEHV